jgi:hypothetical protein
MRAFDLTRPAGRLGVRRDSAAFGTGRYPSRALAYPRAQTKSGTVVPHSKTLRVNLTRPAGRFGVRRDSAAFRLKLRLIKAN